MAPREDFSDLDPNHSSGYGNKTTDLGIQEMKPVGIVVI